MLAVILIGSSCAKMGYEIKAKVNSTTWEIDRSTQYLGFDMRGSVEGTGYFSKLTNIQGFAGMEAKESSYSSLGSLRYDELMKLRSREGPVVVTIAIESGTNETTNESHITVNESANINIDERWPTHFANYKKIAYLGPGIRTRECYQNNGDVVSTSVDSWKLSKENYYVAEINRSVIFVNVTATDVNEVISANKSSYYDLDLHSTGSSTHLDVFQMDRTGASASQIYQDFVGEANMTLHVVMADSVPPPISEQDWLECCFAGEGASIDNFTLSQPSLLQYIYSRSS